MGLRINTNIASIAAQRAMSIHQKSTERAMKQLATGSRFVDGEGSAELAIAENVRGQLKGMEAAKSNAENATSFIQVAESGLNEQNNLLIRMRELAVQSASDTFSGTERDMMNQEFQQLLSEVDRIAKTTSFGSTKLLNGSSKSYEFQVGAYKGEENVIKYVSNTNTTASELGVDSLSVSDRSDAKDSLDTIDKALTKIAASRASFGAVQSRFDSVANYLGLQVENLSEARSRLADTDVAKATATMAQGMAIQQYQIAVLNQANSWPGNVVKLIA